MIEHLTKDTFLTKIFNFEENKEGWKFEGDKPCILDFFADWCGPCKTISPILEELSNEYPINIYKINVDEEQELASAFGVRSIPAILFIPLVGEPQMSVGSMSKNGFVEAITDVLKIQK